MTTSTTQNKIAIWNELQAAINAANKAQKTFEIECANGAGLKVGDTVMTTDRGYYANGNVKIKIDRLSAQPNCFNPLGRFTIVASGRLIKKDGTCGSQRGQHVIELT